MPARKLTMGYPATQGAQPPLFGLLLALPALFLGASCGGSPAPPAAPTRSTAPAAPAAPGLGLDQGWGERSLLRVPVSLELPDARAWHARQSGSFTVLEHAPTHSSLTLRVTRAARLVRPEQCEADARLARPSLPEGDASNVVERRALVAPRGFDVRLVVGVEPRAGTTVHGFALAIGAATGRCYVAAFETQSVGPTAAEDVADRLALVVSGVLETLRVPDAEERATSPIGVK